jgi:hypothetical protein
MCSCEKCLLVPYVFDPRFCSKERALTATWTSNWKLCFSRKVDKLLKFFWGVKGGWRFIIIELGMDFMLTASYQFSGKLDTFLLKNKQNTTIFSV